MGAGLGSGGDPVAWGADADQGPVAGRDADPGSRGARVRALRLQFLIVVGRRSCVVSVAVSVVSLAA